MLTNLKTAINGSLAAAFVACALFALPASAQETISASHLEAAKAAVKATRSLESFDAILPDIAERTRTLFIRSDPAMTAEIDVVVNEVALKLVPRRSELNKVVYEVWARRFTEKELNEIAAFYNTEAGVKLASLGGELSALAIGAAKQWSDVISSEMVMMSRDELNKLRAQ